MVKVLHTADWHLGRSLHGHRRLHESKAFLDWLFALIRDESIDILLVSGDVFDSVTPGTRALEIYHQFLARLFKESECQHAVVTGGNHDSPSVLEFSAAVLKHLDIHVIGSARENVSEELLVLDDASHQPSLIVAAVPYLRDQDIRLSEVNESLADKDQRLFAGIQKHYREIAEAAESINQKLERRLPVIAMGHLFVTGGQLHVETGDGVRDLYVGTLGQVGFDIFPETFDYVALGHLHIPHAVGGTSHIRYSGSPIPMGFGEAGQTKLVNIVEFSTEHRTPTISSREIPCFQELEQIVGDWTVIEDRLRALVAENSGIWLEVSFVGDELIPDLADRVEKLVAGSQVEVLKVMNRQLLNQSLGQTPLAEKLDDLTPEDVFQRQMIIKEIPSSQQQELLEAYQEILFHIENVEAEA
jgi:DNA repair protein SbcD/Mre11